MTLTKSDPTRTPHAAASAAAGIAELLSRTAAGLAQCAQLQEQTQRLSSAVNDFQSSLRPLAWAEHGDQDALRSKLNGLLDQGRRIRPAVSELAKLAGREPPSWSDEATLIGLLGSLESHFREQHSQQARNIYLRVASELSAAKVEHPAAPIRQALEQLVQGAITQLYELAERQEISDPPQLFHEAGWWHEVRRRKAPLESYFAAVQPRSESLAELLSELSRVQFFEETPAVEAAVVNDARKTAEPSRVPMDSPEPSPTTSMMEPPAEASAPVAAAMKDLAAADQTPSTTTLKPSATPTSVPGANLYGTVYCNRCAFPTYDVVPSRLRFYELPCLLLRKRPYRCLTCNSRFWGWT